MGQWVIKMGQYVRFQVLRPENMPEKEWNDVVKDFEKTILQETGKAEPMEYCDEYGLEFNWWRRAGSTCEDTIKELLGKHVGKGFTIKMWYEEREPDETIKI